MAKLDFNFWAFDYEHRITVLADTLAAAEAALDAKSAEIEAEAKKYEADVAAGIIEDEEEYDHETGSMIWSRSWGFDQDLQVIHEGLVSLRKAFVIALYHHWERTAQRWTGVDSSKGNYALLLAVRAKGGSPPERFQHVYHLNNVLKHNSQKDGPKLLQEWPELFFLNHLIQKQVEEGKVTVDWSERVVISSDRMREIFEVIKASGPTDDLK